MSTLFRVAVISSGPSFAVDSVTEDGRPADGKPEDGMVKVSMKA